MISTIIPAQVTTIEDKIAGNLSLVQMVLLVGPVCMATLLIVACPPFVKLSAYKIVMASLIGSISSLLAIRWRNELLISRLVRLLAFYRRPGVYLESIRPACNCDNKAPLKVEHADEEIALNTFPVLRPVSISDRAKLSRYLEHAGKGFLMDKEGRVSVVTRPQA